MNTSRRVRRALCSLVAVAGLAGAAVLTSGGVAAGAEPDGSPSGTPVEAGDGPWPDSSGVMADANGNRAGSSSPASAVGAESGTGPTAEAGWSLLGPPGGDIFDVAASPVDQQIVLAGFAPNGGFGGALYRSGDGGATWSEVPALRGVSVFVIDFADDGTVYAGTMDGVWVSTDGGVSWVALNLRIGLNDQVLALEVDHANPSVVWVGIGSGLGTQQNNVMRTTDGGLTWVNRTPPLPGALSGQAVALDPDDSGTAVVGFDGGMLWVTTDGGATWTDRSAGLTNGPVMDLAYDGTRLLVGGGQLFGSQFLGLFQSTDLGQTWTALHDSTWPVPVVEGVAVDPNDSDTILVATASSGVHRSTDGGATWQIGIGGTSGLSGRSVSFVPGNSGEVLLSTSTRAVFRSADGGDTFAQSSTGIAEIDLHSVSANPTDPDELAIAFQGLNAGGVFTTVDGGTTWSVEPVPPTRYGAVGFAPDGTLYALSTGPTSVAQEGLYRREADGTWTLLGPDAGPLFESDLESMVFSADDPDLIVLVGADFGVAGNEATVWRSADRGQTWTKTYEGPGGQVVLDVEIVAGGTAQEMVASIADRSGSRLGGILRSQDGGSSWSPSSLGLPGGQFWEPRICASSSDPHVIYVVAGLSIGTSNVFRSSDGGVTWLPVGATVTGTATDLACDPADGQMLYMLLTNTPRVARSVDAGVTFTPFGDGLDGVRQPRTLAFAGTSGLLLASGRGSYGRAIERDTVTLDATSRRTGGRFVADLTWEGMTSLDADVYRDGVRIATVPNTGTHTDPVDVRGRGTATYKVCRADSSTCSNEVEVSFGGPRT